MAMWNKQKTQRECERCEPLSEIEPTIAYGPNILGKHTSALTIEFVCKNCGVEQVRFIDYEAHTVDNKS